MYFNKSKYLLKENKYGENNNLWVWGIGQK